MRDGAEEEGCGGGGVVTTLNRQRESRYLSSTALEMDEGDLYLHQGFVLGQRHPHECQESVSLSVAETSGEPRVSCALWVISSSSSCASLF